MTTEEIKLLLKSGIRLNSYVEPKLIETHISWVILDDSLVYKIKKPIQYSFLDFSTLEKRLFYCREEIRLNWRLTFNVYLGIAEIRTANDQILIGGNQGEVIDYAVCMRKLDPRRQMNRLIVRNSIDRVDILKLAAQLIKFHKRTTIIQDKDLRQVGQKFADLSKEKDYITKMIGTKAGNIVERANDNASKFLSKSYTLMKDRLDKGFYRDVHGDLHTRNIFLIDEPVIFDCLEFNADYRQIDLLNEIAFLCMDLEAAGRDDLSKQFFKYYTKQFPMDLSAVELNLLTFYKAYRANVRAKVNCLRAQSVSDEKTRNKILNEVNRYLLLMNKYITSIT